MKYAFLHGRNKALSQAELESFFPPEKIGEGPPWILLTDDVIANPQHFLDRLGGIIKIIEIFGESNYENLTHEIAQYLESKFQADKKNIFSMNAYGAPEIPTLKKILIKLKKTLKTNFKLRFLNKDFQNANHVAVWEEGLEKTGTDVSIIHHGGKYFLGKTVAIQNIDAYARRDYGKPFRDAAAGMLPPKLAQIMINIAKPASQAVVYDPFCGTGTMLMEALLMGFSAVGSDISEKMIEGCQKNLEWLKFLREGKERGRAHSASARMEGGSLEIRDDRATDELHKNKNFFIFQKDATAVSSVDFKNCKIQHGNFYIVSEPFLGPPLSKFPNQKMFEKIQNELLDLYKRFFTNLKIWIPEKTTIVMAFPCFRVSQKQFVMLPRLFESIESLGFKILPVSSQKRTIIYERPDQTVAREIAKFIVP